MDRQIIIVILAVLGLLTALSPVAAAAPVGTTAAEAIPLEGVKSGSLASGESYWYRFWDAGTNKPLGVALNFAPVSLEASTLVIFRVWAYLPRGMNLRLVEIGQGTSSSLPAHTRYWQGGSSKARTYYIQIVNNTSYSIDYAIAFVGDVQNPPELPLAPQPQAAAANKTMKENVKLGSKGAMGRFLVDGAGRTLYYSTRDISGKSHCIGVCLEQWPLFSPETISPSTDLLAADFTYITRADGKKQVTYKGWPLYYYHKDTTRDGALGEGANNTWFVMKVPEYTVMVGNKTSLGSFLVDGGTRKTLYTFAEDRPGQSTCVDACAANWPPFYIPSIVVPSNLNPSDFGVIIRPDGKPQVTYKRMPLYYWSRDARRGDTTGQGVNSIWSVVAP